MSRRISPNSNVEMTKAEKELTKKTGGKIVITTIYGKECTVLLKENQMICAGFTESSSVGSIYIGRVNNVASNIDACFVDIGSETCFLPLKNTAKANVRNRVYDGKIKAGDEIAVKLVREAQKTKLASVTADINLESMPDTALKFSHGALYSCIYSSESSYKDKWATLWKEQEAEEIVTDLQEVYEKLLKEYSSSNVKIRFYEDTLLSLDKLLGITDKMNTALNARIWLKSGGYLVIDITEALTVIDVNSGKYEAKKGAGDKTAVLINKEAALEVAHMLRLRNLSGIILVDFINLNSQEEEQELLDFLKELTKDDICPVKIVDMTALGLVEITRKKISKPLHEQVKGFINKSKA